MKRIIDFDALWKSDHLEECKPEFRYEYLWLYGLADARGSFELPAAKKLHHRVSEIRPDLTEEKIDAAIAEFAAHGLLFTWEEMGKRYGHWVGSTKPGRLPGKGALGRSNYKVDTPPVPLRDLKAYCQEHDVNLKHWPEDGHADTPEDVAEVVVQGESTRAFTDYAVSSYQAKHANRKPTWGQSQYVQFARLYKAQKFTLEQFKAAWDAYLADDDPFVREKQGHSLAWFCSKFDAYANRVLKNPQSKVQTGVPKPSDDARKTYEKLGIKI